MTYFVSSGIVKLSCNLVLIKCLPVVKESMSSAVLQTTPSSPTASHTPVLTSATEVTTRLDAAMHDTAGDLQGSLLRTVTQLMQQQQQQLPQNQVAHGCHSQQMYCTI